MILFELETLNKSMSKIVYIIHIFQKFQNLNVSVACKDSRVECILQSGFQKVWYIEEKEL